MARSKSTTVEEIPYDLSSASKTQVEAALRQVNVGLAAPHGMTLDDARMLPHVRFRPRPERPAWIERRVKQLAEANASNSKKSKRTA